MYHSGEEYVPVSVDVLAARLVVDYTIFHKRKDEFVLLCKDATITPEILKRLREIVKYGNIYVPKQKVSSLLKQSELLMRSSSSAKIVEGYEELTNGAGNLLDHVKDSKSVTLRDVSVMSNTIENRVKEEEPTVILDTINRVREADKYLHTHCVNVSMLNGLIGRWMKMSPKEISMLVNIGLLHDLGKLQVPPEILNKPGKLTEKEFEIIKEHPRDSAKMLVTGGERNKPLLMGVMHHHEKENGMGYPDKLKSHEINVYAKITSVSDVYDAMVTRRCYKEEHSPFEILAWLNGGKFGDLAFEFVNLFISCMTIELTGKRVLLSNGSVAVVSYVDKNNLEFPLVEVDGTIVATSKELYPLALC